MVAKGLSSLLITVEEYSAGSEEDSWREGQDKVEGNVEWRLKKREYDGEG